MEIFQISPKSCWKDLIRLVENKVGNAGLDADTFDPNRTVVVKNEDG